MNNVQKLVATKMSKDAIPADGGIFDALAFLSSKERIVEGAKCAGTWVREAIQTVREAADPNPWRNASDEEIATEILRKIGERKS